MERAIDVNEVKLLEPIGREQHSEGDNGQVAIAEGHAQSEHPPMRWVEKVVSLPGTCFSRIQIYVRT